MAKKIRAILPKYSYEIVMDIIKNQGLDKREELISEQLEKTKDPEIIKSLMDDRPLFILSKIARKAVEEKLSEDEVTSLLREKLRLDKEKGESLMQELKKKLIFFMETVDIEEKEKKERKEEENIKKDNEDKSDKNKENEKMKKVKENEKEGPDPYRESIE